jgi:hypothetical protein
MIAGTQHGGRAGAPTDAGPNVNPRNPHNPMPACAPCWSRSTNG